MGIQVLLAVATGLMLPADTGKGIRGDWTLVKIKQDGKERPIKEGSVRVVVTNEHFIWMEGGKDRACTYQVSEAKGPSWIDFKSLVKGQEGVVISGIFRVKGDELTVCESE